MPPKLEEPTAAEYEKWRKEDRRKAETDPRSEHEWDKPPFEPFTKEELKNITAYGKFVKDQARLFKYLPEMPDIVQNDPIDPKDIDE